MHTYKLRRFPSGIISYTAWIYCRFNISHRDIEDLLADRGIIVNRESIRLSCIKFGAKYARRWERKHRGYGDTFYITGVARRELITETIQITQQHENNRAEQSYESTMVRERGMRRFNSMRRAQRLVTAHADASIYSTWVGIWSGQSIIEI